MPSLIPSAANAGLATKPAPITAVVPKRTFFISRFPKFAIATGGVELKKFLPPDAPRLRALRVCLVLPSNYAVTGDGRTSQTIGLEPRKPSSNALAGVKPIAPPRPPGCGKFPRPVAAAPQVEGRNVSPRES